MITLLSGQKLFSGGFQYARLLATVGHTTLWYTIGAVPAAILSQPGTSYHFNEATHAYTIIPFRQYTYGAGLSPVGFRAVFGDHWRVKPYFEPSVGFLSFTRPTPVPLARRFNFEFQFGAGVQLARKKNHAVRTGVMFLHFSNHGTATYNPGVDSCVVYASYSFFK